MQATVFVGGHVGRPMVHYAEEISKESVVDVKGEVVVAPTPVSGCTQKEVELKIEEVGVLRGTGRWLHKSTQSTRKTTPSYPMLR